MKRASLAAIAAIAIAAGIGVYQIDLVFEVRRVEQQERDGGDREPPLCWVGNRSFHDLGPMARTTLN